jgi:long-chain acyl-CoA synthetase
VSKGAMLLHRNIVANMLQSRGLVPSRRCRSQAEQRRRHHALPLYHIFALTANCLRFMSAAHRRPTC